MASRSPRGCPEWHLVEVLGHQGLTGSAQGTAPPERSGSCHSPLPTVRALESTILISHQPPAPESHIHPHERDSLERNKTPQRIPGAPKSVSRDLGNSVPGIQAKLFHRSRGHAHTAPRLPALKGRASSSPTSLQHQEPRSATPADLHVRKTLGPAPPPMVRPRPSIPLPAGPRPDVQVPPPQLGPISQTSPNPLNIPRPIHISTAQTSRPHP